MKRNRIFFALLFIIIAITFTSCSSENPIGPAIRQTWGTYDYFSYGIYENWKYQETYPYMDFTYELWFYIFGQEYREPYDGWQIAIFNDGEYTGYYNLNALASQAMYRYNFDINEWVLWYEIPFVIGNKWHSETSFKNLDDREWKEILDVEVVARTDISIGAGDYEDCVKLLMTVKNSLVDTTSGNSSYYYVKEEWYAPNVGLVKWVIIETDVEAWRDASRILKKRYHRVYTGSSSAFQYRDSDKITYWERIPKSIFACFASLR